MLPADVGARNLPPDAIESARPRKLPILVVTAKGAEVDRMLGLEMGADDYVVKPFSPREVVARVKALLRRANPASEPDDHRAPMIAAGSRSISAPTKSSLTAMRKELALREFELLRFFVQHPMRVYSREQLLDLVWGRDTFVEPRTVDVHVRRLRQHVERDDANPGADPDRAQRRLSLQSGGPWVGQRTCALATVVVASLLPAAVALVALSVER